MDKDKKNIDCVTIFFKFAKENQYDMVHYCYKAPDPIGMLMMSSDGIALTDLWFDDGSVDFSSMTGDLPVFRDTCRWLDIYFSGRQPDFVPELKLLATPFRKSVWEALLTIPYGKTVSYGDIARRVGCRSAQAVGGAVGHNRIAIIIPCHRVIGSDGSLTGFAGGLQRKKYLLYLEKCHIFAP